MDVENWNFLTTHWTGILIVQKVTLVVRHHCVSECQSQSNVTRLPTKKSLQGENANLIPLKVPISPASVLDSLAKLVLTSCFADCSTFFLMMCWCIYLYVCVYYPSVSRLLYRAAEEAEEALWNTPPYHPHAVSEGVTVQSDSDDVIFNVPCRRIEFHVLWTILMPPKGRRSWGKHAAARINSV